MSLSGCSSRIAYPIGKKCGNSKSNYSAIFKCITHFFSWNFAIIVVTDSLGFWVFWAQDMLHRDTLLHFVCPTPCPPSTLWPEVPALPSLLGTSPHSEVGQGAKQPELQINWQGLGSPPKWHSEYSRRGTNAGVSEPREPFCVTPFIGELKF